MCLRFVPTLNLGINGSIRHDSASGKHEDAVMELSWSQFEQERAKALFAEQDAIREQWMRSSTQQTKRITKELYDQQQRDKRNARLKKLGKV